jgi:glycosyltransferase involved in cell wall biosynthesis
VSQHDVDDRLLIHQYLGAATLVYPSLYEGFGLPPLEAMSLGCPVIASSASSIPEIVGDAGILVDPTSSDAMAQAIDAMVFDEAVRSEYRRRGIERATLFSWERCARETVEVYNKAVA